MCRKAHSKILFTPSLLIKTLDVKAIEPQLSAAWEASKPFFHQLGKVTLLPSSCHAILGKARMYNLAPCNFQSSGVKVIIDYSLVAFRWLQENFPGSVLWAQDTGTALAQVHIYLL